MYRVFVLFLIIGFIACQNKPSEDYNAYYKHSSKGQSLLYGSKNKKKAVVAYQKAFKSTEHPFGRDLEDALKAAILAKDSGFAFQVSEQMARRGCPLSYFLREDYAFLQTNESQWNNFRDQFPEFQEYFSSNFDIALRKELFELKTQDSLYKADFQKGPLEINYCVEQITSISKKLQSLAAADRLPSESKVGLYYDGENIVDLPNKTILLHQYQRGDTIFKKQLKQLINKGFIHINDYPLLSNTPLHKSIEATVRKRQKMRWKNH